MRLGLIYKPQRLIPLQTCLNSSRYGSLWLPLPQGLCIVSHLFIVQDDNFLVYIYLIHYSNESKLVYTLPL